MLHKSSLFSYALLMLLTSAFSSQGQIKPVIPSQTKVPTNALLTDKLVPIDKTKLLEARRIIANPQWTFTLTKPEVTAANSTMAFAKNRPGRNFAEELAVIKNQRYSTAEGDLARGASALAVPRVWAAIMENFRQQDGSVAIPSVLHPYMRGTTVIHAK